MDDPFRPWSLEEYEAQLAILWHMAATGAIRCEALRLSRTDASEMVALASEICVREPIATDETFGCWDGWEMVFGWEPPDDPPKHFEADVDQFDFVHDVIRKLLAMIVEHRSDFKPMYFAIERRDQTWALRQS